MARVNVDVNQASSTGASVGGGDVVIDDSRALAGLVGYDDVGRAVDQWQRGQYRDGAEDHSSRRGDKVEVENGRGSGAATVQDHLEGGAVARPDIRNDRRRK